MHFPLFCISEHYLEGPGQEYKVNSKNQTELNLIQHDQLVTEGAQFFYHSYHRPLEFMKQPSRAKGQKDWSYISMASIPIR